MTRFPVLNRDILDDEEQLAFWDELTQGPRGFYCGGPESRRVPDLYNAYLQFPALGRATFMIADHLRVSENLPGNLRELAVLTTSSMLGAFVEFDFHVPFAVAEGMAEQDIALLRNRETPQFADAQEALIHDANLQLLRNATMKPETIDAVVEAIGYRGMMEFVATVVIYVATSFTMNISNAKLAEDFSVDPDLLRNFFTQGISASPKAED